jgi:hypothetical protein
MSAADEPLARDWHTQGVTIEAVSHAVLTSCDRKYFS